MKTKADRPPFVIHQSDLNAYFDCPARYRLTHKWSPLVPPAPLRIGGQTHKLLEGLDPEQIESLDPAAVRFYERLRQLESDHGYKIIAREVHQIIPIAPGVLLDRRLDALAKTDTGLRVVLDYKTATWPWSTYHTTQGEVAPKAMGFQAPGYLIPPPDEDWPARMDFIVAPERDKKGKVFTFIRSAEEEENFLAAVEIVRKAKVFPMVKGHKCDGCTMRGPCLDEIDWQSHYRRISP